MAVLRRRIEKMTWWDSLSREDPCDGLEINSLVETRRVSARQSRFCMFDADNIAIEYEHKQGGRRYHKVSIMGEVRHINPFKTRKINGYKERIEGR